MSNTIIKSRIRLTLEVSQEAFACLHDLATTGLFGCGGAPEVAARFIDERIQHYVREGWFAMPPASGKRRRP